MEKINVESSIIAPYYGKTGMGTQYRTTETIQELLNNGIIIDINNH